MQQQKFTTIFSSIFLVAGLGMLLISGLVANSERKFLAQAVSTEGTVTSLYRSYSGSGSSRSSTYYPVVDFVDAQHKTHQFQSNTGSNPPSFQEGDTVTVRYLPNHPEKAKIDSFSQLWLFPLIFGIMGLIFSLVAVFVIVSYLRHKKQITWLKQNGRHVQATVTGTGINSSLTVNGAHPFQIHAQWQDPHTNKLYVFHSENIWFDPSAFVKEKEIDVLIDPEHPETSFMDTSFLPQVAS